MEVVYFIGLVGALVFVHELGHFAFAKAFGVEVQRFSIGFGPRIAGFRFGETEYIIAAFPLGGYVRMLGENPHDVVPKAKRGRSFQGQPVAQRMLIVLAGPAMNLLFPLCLFFVMHLGDGPTTPPVVGTVFPERPADGRLLPGDRVLAVDGDEIGTFEELQDTVADSAGEALMLRVERRGSVVEQPVTPVPTQLRRELGRTEVVGRLGIHPGQRRAVLGVAPGSPAESAGLRTFDVIIAAGGQRIDLYDELVNKLGRGRPFVPVTYLRPETEEIFGGLAEVGVYRPRVAGLHLNANTHHGALRAGIETSELYIAEVEEGSPEHRMGLRRGDRLLTLDGYPIRNWSTFLANLRAGAGTPRQLEWRRGTTVHRGVLELELREEVTAHGQSLEVLKVAIANDQPVRRAAPVPHPSPVFHALRQAFEETGEMISLTGYSLLRLVQGRLGVESLGGPLMIFSATQEAAAAGASSYLRLMAFISVNLGLINLLPIPLLDGGHLLFFLVEAVGRRRVSRRLRSRARIIGLLMLLTLMLIALRNDLRRFVGSEDPQTLSQSDAQ